MSVTTIELRERVARQIRIKRADMELDEADAAEIDERIGEVTAFLRELGLAWWVDNAIPEVAVMPMTLMVAAWAAPAFGKGGQGHEEGFLGGQTLLRSIRSNADVSTLQVDYY